jgi:hypothetical protein
MKTYCKSQSSKSKFQRKNISRKHKKSGTCRFFYSNFELCSLNFALWTLLSTATSPSAY